MEVIVLDVEKLNCKSKIPTAQSLTYFDIWGYTTIIIKFIQIYPF